MELSSNEHLSVIDKENMYRQIVEYSVEPIAIHADYKVVYVNQAARNFLRIGDQNVTGLPMLDLFREVSKVTIAERIRLGLEEKIAGPIIEETLIRPDGSTVDVELNCNPVIFGDRDAIQTTIKDITVRKQKEREHEKLLREINELSAPIVPLLSGIGILPLVGSIDSNRAEQIVNNIPTKIQQQDIECLIIDLSGVHSFDQVIVESIFNIINVLKLLGIQVVITGMRPDLAKEAIQFGLNLSSVKIFNSVKRALSELGLRG